MIAGRGLPLRPWILLSLLTVPLAIRGLVTWYEVSEDRGALAIETAMGSFGRHAAASCVELAVEVGNGFAPVVLARPEAPALEPGIGQRRL